MTSVYSLLTTMVYRLQRVHSLEAESGGKVARFGFKVAGGKGAAADSPPIFRPPRYFFHPRHPFSREENK